VRSVGCRDLTIYVLYTYKSMIRFVNDKSRNNP
jgi:hypothetical protein